MALTGNIADWSLADLLQIVAAERKSGTLTLRREDDEVHLDFAGGLLVGASEHRSRPDRAERRRHGAGLLTGRRGAQALGTESPGGFLAFLVATGRVRPDQARAVILLAHEMGADTVSALVKAELMTSDMLEEAMTAYAQDLFTRVLAWESGEYTFVATKSPAMRVPAGTVALTTDGLLLEGMRRIDEQPRIGAVVQPETIFTRADDGAAVPADLGAREAAVLALIDGRRDVRSLAPLAQLSEYQAAEALYNLHQGGFIRARDGVTPDADTLARIAPPAARPRAALLQVAALALVLAVSLAFRLGVHRSIRPDIGVALGAAPGAAPLPAREQAALRFAEQLFTAYTGRQATSTEDLVRAGLLPGGFGRWEGADLAPAAPPAP